MNVFRSLISLPFLFSFACAQPDSAVTLRVTNPTVTVDRNAPTGRALVMAAVAVTTTSGASVGPIAVHEAKLYRTGTHEPVASIAITPQHEEAMRGDTGSGVATIVNADTLNASLTAQCGGTYDFVVEASYDVDGAHEAIESDPVSVRIDCM